MLCNKRIFKNKITLFIVVKYKEVIHMLKDCNYNKAKLLHYLSKLLSFIQRHAKEDAKKDGHKECAVMYEELEADLEKHINNLKEAVEMASKEGKFD